MLRQNELEIEKPFSSDMANRNGKTNYKMNEH